MTTTPQSVDLASQTVTTIERTSKKWKLQLMLSQMAIFLTFVLMLLLPSYLPFAVRLLGTFLFMLLFLASAIWYGVVKWLIWWHHG